MLLSTYVFAADTTEEQQQLAARIMPLLSYFDHERIELRDETKFTPAGDECNLYVVIHTANMLSLIGRLTAYNII